MYRFLLWSTGKAVSTQQRASRWVMNNPSIERQVRQGHLTPNGLTYTRIGIAFIIYSHILTGLWLTREFSFLVASRWVIFYLFLIATITDMFDGTIARLYSKYISPIDQTLGINLDRHADKLLTGPILAFYWGFYSPINKYLVVLNVGGDMVATILAIFAKKSGYLIPSNDLGKGKMVALCFCIGWIILGLPQAPLQVYLSIALTLGFVSLLTNLSRVWKNAYPVVKEISSLRKTTGAQK